MSIKAMDPRLLSRKANVTIANVAPQGIRANPVVMKPLSLYNGPMRGWNVFVLMKWPTASYITTLSLHQFNLPFVRYLFPIQEADNAPVTYLGLPVAMGGGIHLIYGGSYARLDLENAMKKNRKYN
ncbi:hypothetical protein EVAR_74384_1 [Eumeta japonica]|uniref:Uncharacterized protein n=1 Tax=Eumeta variegata TaxID=151549 RepID=A0A4C1SD27_EUMVA|nr:hypothetical protein EVAR_74384_1 [Eumeta japonica]